MKKQYTKGSLWFRLTIKRLYLILFCFLQVHSLQVICFVAKALKQNTMSVASGALHLT